MNQKTFNHLFICVCALFLAHTTLMLYLHKVSKSCECEMELALHPDYQDIKGNSENFMKGKSTKLQRNTMDFSSMMYFEPLVEEEFPTVLSMNPRIPHIIHQASRDERIPAAYTTYVKSMVENNPNWTYYIWTDESSRRFVADRFPKLLQLWDNNKMSTRNAIRYLVLYEFGGLYADLDLECKRPLDNITMKYACIFPTEPFEQSVFRIHVPYLISNAIMLCRPKHPFLKQIVDTLHQYQPMLEEIDVAGATFLTSQYIRYNKITADYVYKLKQSNESNSPYFYKGELAEEDNDAVYVPNTQYFINSLSQDWINEKHYNITCAESGAKSVVVQKACNELTRRLSQKYRDRYAFTDHHWVLPYNKTKFIVVSTLNKIVNRYIIY